MKTYLEINEIEKLEQSAVCNRDKLLIRVLFHMGCRVTEALAITADDIDFITGTINIIHLKTRLKFLCPDCESRLSRSNRFCPRCGIKVDQAKLQQQEHQKRRTLPLDPQTLSILKKYIVDGGPLIINGNKYLFGINRHRAWQIITGCAQRAGLPGLTNPDTGRSRGISPHRLRDAFAVHAMKQDDTGDGLRLLQEHLGHASFDTTAKYRKVAGKEHRRWYDKLWLEGA